MIKLANLVEGYEKIDGNNKYALNYIGGSGKGALYSLWYNGTASKLSDKKEIKDYQYRTRTFDGVTAYYVTKDGYVTSDDVGFSKVIKKNVIDVVIQGQPHMAEIKDVMKIIKKNFPDIKFSIVKYKNDNAIEIKK